MPVAECVKVEALETGEAPTKHEFKWSEFTTPKDDSSGPVTQTLPLRWRPPILKPRIQRPKKTPRTKKEPEDAASRDGSAGAVIKQPPRVLDVPEKPTYRLAQWWFCTPSGDTSRYKSAYTHWVEAGWNIVHRSDLFLECIKLYTTRKVSHLCGRPAAYVEQKTRVMQHINLRLSKTKNPKPLTLVGIGILAYCSLLDAEFEAARTHLSALQAVGIKERFADAGEEWLYVVWVDLRYSLIHGTVPLLDYCVPRAYRSSIEQDMSAAWPDAEHAMSGSPISNLIGRVDFFDLWVRVYTLTTFYKTWQQDAVPPFGLLYDVEYRLRVLHAQLVQGCQTNAPAVHENCTQILLAAVQATVWIVSRFWAPASPGSRRFLAAQANSLIEATTPFELVWASSGASSDLLEWTLATITAFSIESGQQPSPSAVRILRRMASEPTSFKRIQTWPWVEDWHLMAFEQLWKAVNGNDDDDQMALSKVVPTRSLPFYLGAVEFY